MKKKERTKKVRITPCAAAILFSLLIAGNAMAAARNSNVFLIREMADNDVTDMQTALSALGYLQTPVTGYYDSYTEEAVRNFQDSYGLYVDGEAGPQTLSLLYSMVPEAEEPVPATAGQSEVDFQAIYRYGAIGGAVMLIQQQLQNLGYLSGAVDGEYGADTEAAVKRFQRANGLYADGEAGPQTLAILFGAGQAASEQPEIAEAPEQQKPSEDLPETNEPQTEEALLETFDGSSTYLSEGSRGREVQILQNRLATLGYFDSVVDGDYGPITREAVFRFQQDNGLYADGEAGPQTLGVLFGNQPQNEKKKDFTVEKIKALQTKLIELGYADTIADGDYGPITKSAVQTYQAIHGDASQSGELTERLYQQILNETQPYHPIDSSSSYTDVIALQQALARNRMIGTVDGWYGSQTKAAVTTVQRVFGLPQTGVADPKTMYYIYNYEQKMDNQNDVQGYHSNTNWLIYINTATNRMYVYNGSIWNWNLVYNWSCSTGAADTPTCLGEYTTNFRGYSFGEGYTCYYFTSFNGPYYIHSTLFNENTWVNQDARLGMNLSHGCVRLAAENAKWIYDNIPLGTKVVVV